METTRVPHDGPEVTLGELAVRLPAASRVFRESGLDYCCGGRRTLAAACAEKGLDPQAILSAIHAGARDDRPAASWQQRPLSELIDFILDRYHASLRRELPELCRMAAKVEETHGAKPSCPHGLAALLDAAHEAVLSHLEKEEQILFPMILGHRGAHASGPIQVMEHEHHQHGANLERIRELTDGLTAPREACATWQALYLRLGELEADLMEHIHLENNVLFPRALCE